MTFQGLVKDFESAYMPRLAKPTRAKYASLLQQHVMPEFATREVETMTTRELDAWLATKSEAGLSWATCAALRNLISSVFTRHHRWGTYTGLNPARYAEIGRRKAAYEHRKLSIKQTRDLLLKLRPDVRLVVMVALFCGLRISEVLGLQWKHVDFEHRLLLIRQRYWRGDLDRTKTESSDRDVPYGALHALLRGVYPKSRAAKEGYVFSIRTRSVRGITRDDRSIRRNFLRPAAEKLGIYHRGFGFHSFRREAITAVARRAGALQASKFAGHSHVDQTLLYTLNAQARAVRSSQEPFLNMLRSTK